MWGTPVETQVRRHTVSDETGEYDSGLFEQLRAKRKALADAEGVPPYTVFSDRALQEMATYFPHSTEALETMHGVGPVKVEKYADSFLPIIRDYCQQHGLTEQPKSARVVIPIVKAQSRSKEVGDRFQAGESVAELMQAYEVKRGTITSHLSKYAQAGNLLPVARLHAESSLSTETKERVLETFDELGTDALRPVFDAFNEEISYEELHLIQAIYWTNNQQTEPISFEDE